MLVRLRVRELAESKGYNLSRFQLDARLPPTTAARYWHGNGKDGPVQAVKLAHIATICALFGCGVEDVLKLEPSE